MTNPMTNLFHRAHYNIIAAQIREQIQRHVNTYPEFGSERQKQRDLSAVHALTDLALALAKRFQQDNENFLPLQFLDACTPDSDTMPLSEFWEGYRGNDD